MTNFNNDLNNLNSELEANTNNDNLGLELQQIIKENDFSIVEHQTDGTIIIEHNSGRSARIDSEWTVATEEK